ncbi:hypothetical protein FQZ97_878940 [compost metagenome]
MLRVIVALFQGIGQVLGIGAFTKISCTGDRIPLHLIQVRNVDAMALRTQFFDRQIFHGGIERLRLVVRLNNEDMHWIGLQ